MSYIVALTGGICSGKSIIARKFSELSKKISIIDADKISRKITKPGSTALYMISEYFGSEILFPNGSLNRSMLREIIFLNSKDKKWLEKLLHPLIRKETQKTISLLSNKSSYILWVVPLLIENNLHDYADRILTVNTCIDFQLTRIINRDRINKKYAENILLSQTSHQRRSDFADDIIENNKNFDETTRYILMLHQHYLKIKHKNHK